MKPRFVLVALLSLLPFPAVGAQGDIQVETFEIPSWDGIVLSAELYWSSSVAGTRVPAVLMTHGWAGSKSDLVDEARWLASLGYVVLAYDSRGFGASEGTVGLDGPDEWADVSHLVSWLALLQIDGGPQVLLDDAEEEDPRLGMYGYSYGGAIQLLAAAQDGRIDALVPDITWSDLRESLAPNSVVKRGWVDLLFWGGILGSHGAMQGDPNTGGMDERLRDWYLQALQTGRFPKEADAALAERSPVHHLEDLDAAVLLTQGWRDTLFDPDEATTTFAVLSSRTDAATHLLLHPGGHGHALSGPHRGHVRAEVASFFAHHLDDAELDPIAAVQWHDPQADTWRSADVWPPAAVERVSVAAGDGGPVLLAQAPPATSHTESQEFEGDLGSTQRDAPLPTSTQVALAVAAPTHLLGVPVVQVNITPGVEDLTLFFSLVDVGLGGAVRVVGNQVTPWRIEGKNGFEVALEVPLVGVAHTVQPGHRLVLRVATSDTGYLGSRETGTVELAGGALRVALPVYDLEEAQTEAEDPPAGPDRETPGVSGPLVALFVLAALWAGRREARRRVGRAVSSHG